MRYARAIVHTRIPPHLTAYPHRRCERAHILLCSRLLHVYNYSHASRYARDYAQNLYRGEKILAVDIRVVGCILTGRSSLPPSRHGVQFTPESHLGCSGIVLLHPRDWFDRSISAFYTHHILIHVKPGIVRDRVSRTWIAPLHAAGRDTLRHVLDMSGSGASVRNNRLRPLVL